MDISPTTYAFATIIALLGFFIGMFLAKAVPEELKSGIEFFVVIKKMLLLAIFVLFVNVIEFSFLLKILVYTLIVLLFAMVDLMPFQLYMLLTFLLLLAAPLTSSFFIQASLVFLYGLPAGTLYVVENMKDSFKKTVSRASLELLPAVAFVILFVFLWMRV
jgi:hypothetical protein